MDSSKMMQYISTPLSYSPPSINSTHCHIGGHRNFRRFPKQQVGSPDSEKGHRLAK